MALSHSDLLRSAVVKLSCFHRLRRGDFPPQGPQERLTILTALATDNVWAKEEIRQAKQNVQQQGFPRGHPP